MQFDEPLVEGTLIRRYKKFLADVRLRNGDEVTAHCAHPGSMMGCSEPGSKVLLSVNEDPRRRFKHQLEIIYVGRTPVGIHTGRPATVVTEAIMQGRVPELAGYATLRRQPKSKSVPQVDLVLEGNGLRSCHIAVTNVTLAADNIAFYPDAPAEDALRNLSALTDLVREGHRSVVFFVVQRADAASFKPADHIDTEFSGAFRDACARGVEALCYRARVSRKAIELETKLPVELNP